MLLKGKQGRMFFFEKKNQKTFARLLTHGAMRVSQKRIKSFCFFFFRKRRFFLPALELISL
jgi:hypothetical protein